MTVLDLLFYFFIFFFCVILQAFWKYVISYKIKSYSLQIRIIHRFCDWLTYSRWAKLIVKKSKTEHVKPQLYVKINPTVDFSGLFGNPLFYI